MFLIRTAFWLSLLVLLLPTDTQQQQKLYATASSAATHAATFCDRNVATCVKGGQYWATFKQKLEFGARMAMDLATERMKGTAATPPTLISADPDRQMLAPADLRPEWRRPQPRAGA